MTGPAVPGDGQRDRYAQCDDTCTVDCGACKGAGRPAAPVVRAEDVAGELRDGLGRPAVLPGNPREQVREAIRRELVAWGYAELPVRSLSIDLTGAVFRLAVVRSALDGEDGDRG